MSKFTTHRTDEPGAVRLQFINNSNRILFSISPDNKVTLNGDIDLDEASRVFWEAVEQQTPSAPWRPADATTDDDGQLARVQTLPAVSKGKPQGYDVLFINGVSITGMSPGSIVAKAVKKALKTRL